ncbi:MAG: SRPBCC domain-containing protein [Ignavibacteriae bacterium]|nr:SRPBCC domain-containing protein [Ignavibacteriota bacterium]
MKKIEKKVHINAPVSKVWQALINTEQLAQWLMPNDFVSEVGKSFAFTGDMGEGPFPINCTIKELVENKKLVYTWRLPEFEGDSEVSIELEGNGETDLTLTHTGWENIGPLGESMSEGHNKGWDEKLAKLKEVAEA